MANSAFGNTAGVLIETKLKMMTQADYKESIERLIDEYEQRSEKINNMPHKDVHDLNLQIREINMIEMFIKDLELIIGRC